MCAFLHVWHTAYRGAPSIFGKSTSLRSGHSALLPFSSDLPDVIGQLNSLAIVHGMKYDTTQSVVALMHLTSIGCLLFSLLILLMSLSLF